MKKIFYGIGLSLCMLLVTPAFAEIEGFNNDVCDPQFVPPVSCWGATGGVGQEKTKQTHCDPAGNLSKDKQNEFFKEFEEYKAFLEKRSEEDKLKLSAASQALLTKEIPTPAKVEANPKDTMQDFQNIIEEFYKKSTFVNSSKEIVQCKYDDHGTDSKYGLCTREAFKQFLQLIPKDCTEPKPEKLIEIPSTRCRVEIKFISTIFRTVKTNKKVERDAAEKIEKAKTPPGKIVEEDYMTELEKELKAKLGKTINLILAGGQTFYFEVAGRDASDFKEKTADIFKDKDFLKKTEVLGEKTYKYSEFVDTVTVTKEHCAVDTLNNVDIGGLRPRYLVGSSGEKSETTRHLSGSVEDLTFWFQRFGRKLVGFIAAVAVFFIVWNAFGMVTSMGDADKISSSKKAIQWILIGLALAIFAYVIIKTIISLTYLSAV